MNPVTKSFDSFKGIGNDFLKGLETRANKALDSPYDFTNYATIGLLDSIVVGSKQRYDKMRESPSDFVNWLSFGTTGMVKEALFPKEPLSKE
ncbi:MAG TPA: hypothetical protein DCZ10_08870, partial [Pelotomaculum sp.]|nr:hypothetical protein [Pelotomaculum sp.]